MSTKQRTKTENWNGKCFGSVTKMEGLPVPDTDGHFVGLMVIEGVVIYDNGEIAWSKANIIFDVTKGKGAFAQYSTSTFQDGGTISSHVKSKVVGGPTNKWTDKIVNGTGRFKGIKGTINFNVKYPSPEGGVGRKILGEFTSAFTLP
jgi:hypothetical protein